MSKFKSIIDLVQQIYNTKDSISLHEPQFFGNEKLYLNDVIESTFVSSVGKYINQFEDIIVKITNTNSAVAVVNGTAGLHTALRCAGVMEGEIVITQSLTFIATCNAIKSIGAEPVFVDVSLEGFGLCPNALSQYLDQFAYVNNDNECCLKQNDKIIKAVMPMHTFGHPVKLNALVDICNLWNLKLVEDAAESLGSFYKGQHTGTFGEFGVVSFNGNKIVTTGGGGVILCKSKEDGKKVKHITTTAKVPHLYEYIHDEVGYNYRMPNLNAALGCAQLEKLDLYLKEKRCLANIYKDFFNSSSFKFVDEPSYAKSNFWLNAIICKNKNERNRFLNETNSAGIMTRPIWTLMHNLKMYADCERGDLKVSEWLQDRVVNLPSTPVIVQN